MYSRRLGRCTRRTPLPGFESGVAATMRLFTPDREAAESTPGARAGIPSGGRPRSCSPPLVSWALLGPDSLALGSRNLEIDPHSRAPAIEPLQKPLDHEEGEHVARDPSLARMAGERIAGRLATAPGRELNHYAFVGVIHTAATA